MPAVPSRPSTIWSYLDHPGRYGLAHRGGNEVAAENTVAAFAHAVGLGYRYLETDVHLSLDGVLVAFHDADLARVAGLPGTIADHRWDELAAIDLGDGARIPTMTELLSTFPDARFNIDPKADASVDPLVRVIREQGAIDRVCVGAFSDDRIARSSAALGPGLCTSAGPRHVAALWASARAGRALSAIRANPVIRRLARQHGCVQVPAVMRGIRIVDTHFIELTHALGLQVHVWTINDRTQMDTLFDAGVDAVISDRISVLKDVLVERGDWTPSGSGTRPPPPGT